MRCAAMRGEAMQRIMGKRGGNDERAVCACGSAMRVMGLLGRLFLCFGRGGYWDIVGAETAFPVWAMFSILRE